MRLQGRLFNGIGYWGRASRDKGERSYRGWLNTFRGNIDTDEGYKELREYNFQFIWGKRCTTLGGEVERNSFFSDSHGGLSGHFGIPKVFTFYWGITNVFKDTYKDPTRTWGFRWMFGEMGALGTISIDWDKQETCDQEEIERKGSFHHWIDVADALLGSPRVFKADPAHFERGKVYVCMPEGMYGVTVEMERWAWIRSRWPIPLIREDWSVGADGDNWPDQRGIPAPSRKYEDDALCSTGFSVKTHSTMEAAARAFANKVAEDRLKYGDGMNWRPRGQKTLQKIDQEVPVVSPDWESLLKKHAARQAEAVV